MAKRAVRNCRALAMGAAGSGGQHHRCPDTGARRSVGEVRSLKAGDAELGMGDCDPVRQEVGDVTAF